MSTSNLSQLLIKNLSILKASNPLFINLAADAFIQDYQSTYPDAQLSFLNFHYGEFLAHQRHGRNCQFDHSYRAQDIHDIAIIAFPKSKAELAYTLAMLSEALDDNSIVYFVGEKNSGVKSVEKLAKDYISGCQKDDAARHCMLFSAQYVKPQKPFQVKEWFNYYPLQTQSQELTICALPGVFSQLKLDVGTKLLLEHLPNYSNESILDFGCGAGVIGATIAHQCSDASVTLADVNALALASSKETFAKNQLVGQFIATDSMSHIASHYDHVISNPPFHQGLNTHYQATEDFLDAIAKFIKPKGSLTIVANSFLKYQPIMEKRFKSVNQVAKANGFTIYLAEK